MCAGLVLRAVGGCKGAETGSLPKELTVKMRNLWDTQASGQVGLGWGYKLQKPEWFFLDFTGQGRLPTGGGGLGVG